MKALHVEITNELQTHIAVVKRDEEYSKSPFHYHPELELVYIKEGYGNRIVGDKLDSFTAGDMVFLGANLPHVWLNDEVFYKGFTYLRSKSIVLYFNKDVFSKGFYQLKESGRINDFFVRAGRGIKITGKTMQKVAEKMEELVEMQGFDRIIGLMEILHTLSISKDVEYLANELYTGVILQSKPDRLSEVYTYISNNFFKDISLEHIAKVANLTPPAFCRLFKQRTNKHFIEYLNEVRISKACKYLLESNLNISEIAFNCGYKTLSNFNKIFKKSTGLSPKEYRQKAAL